MKLFRLALGDRSAQIWQNSERLLQVIAHGVAGLPLLWITSLIAKYVVNFPFYDGWLVGIIVHMWESGQLEFGHLLAQHNESRKFFPKIILGTLAKLTHWDTRYENILVVLGLILISYGLYRLLQKSLPQHPWLVVIAWGLMNLLVCSPLQYENLLWGLQYIMFVVPACLIGLVLWCSAQRPQWQIFLGSFAYCFFATFTFANGLVLWIVATLPLTITIVRQRSQKAWWLLAAWLTSFLGVLGLYFRNYTKPESAPTPMASLDQVGQYFLSWVGGSLSGLNLAISPAIGATILALFGVFSLGTIAYFYYVDQVQQRSTPAAIAPAHSHWLQPIAPWLTLGCYSLLSGGLTAAGRSGFGLFQSMSPRYVTVSSYLCIAIIGLAAVSLAIAIERWGAAPFHGSQSPNQRPWRLGTWWRSAALPLKLSYAIALFLISIHGVLQLNSYQAGLGGMAAFNRQVRLGKACAILSPIIQDRQCIQKIHPDPEFTRVNLPQINDIGLLHPPLITTPTMESFGTTELGDVARGKWESWQWQPKVELQPEQPQLSDPQSPHWVAKGWAVLKQAGRPADAVILAVRNPKTGLHRPIAIAWVVKSRGKIAKRFGQDFWVAGWEAALTPEQLPQNPRELSAWAFDSSIPRAYKLPQTYQWAGQSATPAGA